MANSEQIFLCVCVLGGSWNKGRLKKIRNGFLLVLPPLEFLHVSRLEGIFLQSPIFQYSLFFTLPGNEEKTEYDLSIVSCRIRNVS